MSTETTQFQFTYNLSLINAEKTTAGDKEFYTLHFSNEIPPVKLVAVKLPGGKCEWNTIPAGNKELADSLGSLIEQYLREQDDKTEE